MRLTKTGAFPVGGKPFTLFAVSLFGVLLSPYLSEIVAFPWATPFVVLLVLSFVSTVELDGDVLVLTYGFIIKQRIPLDSIEEVALLSRLDWTTVGKYFPQYVLAWLIATLWIATDFLVFHGSENPVRLYGDVFVLSTALLLILVLTLPRARKEALKALSFVLMLFVSLYMYWEYGPKMLALSAVLIAYVFILLRALEESEFVMIIAERNAYLLSTERPDELFAILRGDARWYGREDTGVRSL